MQSQTSHAQSAPNTCQTHNITKIQTKSRASVIEFLSPHYAATLTGWQEDKMTIAGRRTVMSMSHFSLFFFFRRFRRQDVRHGNAVQQCNGLQLSGTFRGWSMEDSWVLEALLEKMSSVKVEEVTVQLMRVSGALCADGAFTLAENHHNVLQ